MDSLGGMGAVGSTAVNLDQQNPGDLSQQINAIAAAMLMGSTLNGTAGSTGTDLAALATLQGIDISSLAGLDPAQASAVLSMYGIHGTPDPPAGDSLADKKRNKFT